MKYLAVAGLATAVAAQGWESYDPPASTSWSAVPVIATSSSTWSAWSTPVIATSSSSWSAWSTPLTPVVQTTWSPIPPPANPTTWAPVPPPNPPAGNAVWSQWNANPVYTTTVVTAITTYCAQPTVFVHAGVTYSVTAATTITITDCPCTISVPVYTQVSTSCASAPTSPAVPVVPASGASTWANVPATPVAPYGTGWTGVPATNTAWAAVGKYTGAANKVNAGAAGLVGVIGAAALLL